MKEQDNEKTFFRLLYILKLHTDSWADADSLMATRAYHESNHFAISKVKAENV